MSSSNVIDLEQAKADRIARLPTFEVKVTDEDRFLFLGLDREISRREAQGLYRQLGALLGVHGS